MHVNTRTAKFPKTRSWLVIQAATIIAGLILSAFLTACGSSSSFSIEGTWKNTGEGTFGQMQKGAVVVFDGQRCNVFSPGDTYALYKDGNDYKLDVTGLMGGTVSFKVAVNDSDHITLSNQSVSVDLTRASADSGLPASDTNDGNTAADVPESDTEEEPATSGLDRYLSSESDDNSGFYLYQNDSLYTLGDYNSGVGALYYLADDEDETTGPYSPDFRVVSTDSESDEVPEYKAGDQIRYYSANGVEDLQLVKVVPAGYTVPQGDLEDVKSDSITDSSGRVYETKFDLIDLPQGEPITFSWYEGTKYNEEALTADYPVYKIDPSLPTQPYDTWEQQFYDASDYEGEDEADVADYYKENVVDYYSEDAAIKIKGSLGKEGYAEYDISSVPAGLYLTSDGGLLRIV